MSRTRRTDKVPNIDAGSHFVRENAGFRAIPNVQTSPVHSSSTAIRHHYLANQTKCNILQLPHSISNLSTSLLSPSLISPPCYLLLPTATTATCWYYCYLLLPTTTYYYLLLPTATSTYYYYYCYYYYYY